MSYHRVEMIVKYHGEPDTLEDDLKEVLHGFEAVILYVGED